MGRPNLHIWVVVDGQLFRADPHVLHQHEFDGGRHRREGVVLKGQGHAVRSRGAEGQMGPRAPPTEEQPQALASHQGPRCVGDTSPATATEL